MFAELLLWRSRGRDRASSANKRQGLPDLRPTGCTFPEVPDARGFIGSPSSQAGTIHFAALCASPANYDTDSQSQAVPRRDQAASSRSARHPRNDPGHQHVLPRCAT